MTTSVSSHSTALMMQPGIPPESMVPPDLMKEVFSCLSAEDALSTTQVSKLWKEYSKSPMQPLRTRRTFTKSIAQWVVFPKQLLDMLRTSGIPLDRIPHIKIRSSSGYYIDSMLSSYVTSPITAFHDDSMNRGKRQGLWLRVRGHSNTQIKDKGAVSGALWWADVSSPLLMKDVRDGISVGAVRGDHDEQQWVCDGGGMARVAHKTAIRCRVMEHACAFCFTPCSMTASRSSPLYNWNERTLEQLFLKNPISVINLYCGADVSEQVSECFPELHGSIVLY